MPEWQAEMMLADKLQVALERDGDRGIVREVPAIEPFSKI
jgi:hypothetical protein